MLQKVVCIALPGMAHFEFGTITEVFGIESFIREQDRTAAPLPETDLFAGLRD